MKHAMHTAHHSALGAFVANEIQPPADDLIFPRPSEYMPLPEYPHGYEHSITGPGSIYTDVVWSSYDPVTDTLTILMLHPNPDAAPPPSNPYPSGMQDFSAHLVGMVEYGNVA